MARKNESKEFTVKPLSSPELDGHFGEPQASKVNQDATALLAQMGGAEAVKKTEALDDQMDVVKHLTRLDLKVTLPKRATLPEAAEKTDLASFLSSDFMDAMKKAGVDLRADDTVEFVAQFPGWIVELTKTCKTYDALEGEQAVAVTRAVVGEEAELRTKAA